MIVTPSARLTDRRRSRGTEATLRSLVDDAFHGVPGAGDRVGLELEVIPVWADETIPRPVALEAGQRIFADDPVLTAGATVSFEPGGQLELSIPPHRSIAGAVAAARSLMAEAERIASGAGMRLLREGTNPWHRTEAIGLQLAKPRYTAMQAHFDRIGPAGRRMMRQTASLQVCLDLGSASEAPARWRVANLAGPSLLAAYANSPRLEGTPTGAVSTRSLIWQAADNSRTGFDGGQVGGPEAYAAFALDAQVFGIDHLRGQPDQSDTPTLRQCIAVGCELSEADLLHHLSTLFPPVRPRGYLEIRYLDMLADIDLCGAVTTLSLLAYDPAARDAALRLLGDDQASRHAWRKAAAVGLRSRRVRDTAAALLDLAAAAARRQLPGTLPPDSEATLRAHCERAAAGICPADVVRPASMSVARPGAS